MNIKNRDKIIQTITQTAMKVLNEWKMKCVPIGVSNRHVHLCREDLDFLFGRGYTLTKLKDLGQPGQFAAKETVKIIGSKGSFEKVRILGPVRDHTQVEVSLTDGHQLGIQPPIKLSGNIKNTPGILIKGPNGSVAKNCGVIVALRHIHMTPKIASIYEVKNGEMVDVETKGIRQSILKNVAIRISKDSRLEMHIDTDEANSCGLKNNDTVKILKNKG